MMAIVPDQHRERLGARAAKQERFARRVGLKLITFTVRLFFLSLTFTLVFFGVLELMNNGWLVLPTRDVIEGTK